MMRTTVVILLCICAFLAQVLGSTVHAFQPDDEEFFAASLSADVLDIEDFITDISIAIGDDKGAACPDGFTKLWNDLNAGAKGKFIFLCYKKEVGKTPITDIKVVSSGSKIYGDACPGYQFIDGDLNQGAGGSFVNFCVKKGSGSPVTEIKFVSGQNAYQSQCSGYTSNPTDLNKGAGGDYIYLCFKKDSQALEKVRIYDVVYDMTQLTENDNNVKTINQIIVDNNDKTDSQAQTLTGSYSISETKSFSLTNQVSVGLAVEITAGSPLIGASNKWTVSASYTFTSTYGESTTKSETKEYQFQCSAAAYTQTECDAVYRTAKVNVPYNAKAEYVYMDGRKEIKAVTGTYAGVASSSFYMTKKVLKEYSTESDTPGSSSSPAPASEGLSVLQLLDTLQADIENMRAVIGCSDTLFGTHCYKVAARQGPYSAAEAYCDGWGGKVTSIVSAEENAFVQKACAGKVAWLGLKRDSASKFATWADGTAVGYSSWAPGEPNNFNGKEDATQMYPDGKWNDIPGDSTGACFVCKK